MSDQPSTSNTPPISPAGCLLRLVWTLVGVGAIFLSLATIAATRPPLPSALDLVVALTLVVTIAARRLDITRHGGRTLADEPATLRHWRRYSLLLLGVTLAAWSLAHLIAGSFTAAS